MGRKETTLFSGSLAPLCAESNFQNETFGAGGGYNIIKAKAASVKGEHLYYNSVDFGGTINLSGRDKITVEVRLHSDIFANGTYTDATNSYMSVDAVEGIGLQYVTPSIKVITIGAGEGSFRHTLGDNVTGISLLHMGTNTIASPVWQSVRLYSDRYDVNDDYNTLLGNRKRQMPGSTSDSRGQCFNILSREVDKCRVELDLNPTQVSASENVIVYRQYETGRKLVAKASAKKQKHTRKAIAKVQKRA